MIVWATEFPAPVGTSVDAVLALADKWLRGSPHLPWRDVELPPVPAGELVRTEHEGQTVQRVSVSTAGSRWTGLRHTWTEDSKREWTTDIIAWATPSSAAIAVRLDCNLLSAGLGLPRPKKPYIVKLLLQQFNGGADAWLDVRDQPTLLEEAQVDNAAAIIRGTTPVKLPIVYVSSGYGHRPMIDAVELSEWLAGMAHVVVEPSRHFSFALARSVEKRNPYGGAVAVLWPRALERLTRFLPRDFDSADDLVAEVADRVRSALAAVRPTPELTWPFVQEYVARQRIEVLRSTGSTQVNEYVAAFDAELQAKDERINSSEREIGRLLAELRRVEATADASGGLLVAGEEQELYPGELKDAVHYALRSSLTGLEAAGRRRHIVEDLLSANKATGNDEEIAESVKRCFATSGELTTSNRRTLEELGFEIAEDGKHNCASYRGDNRYAFVISKSSSDHRAGKNLASEINRKLFK